MTAADPTEPPDTDAVNPEQAPTEPASDGAEPTDGAAPSGAVEPGALPATGRLSPQKLLDQGAVPPDAPARVGVFVDVPSLRTYVGELLRVYLGHYEVDVWSNFTFEYEDARVFVTVGMAPMGPQVGVFSVTNLDTELTDELARFLLTTNHRIGFGAFAYDDTNRAVWFRHMLVGTTVDGPELNTVVAAVASTAAHFDDIIRDRFGGPAFRDASTDDQAAAHPPIPNASGYL